MGFFTTTAKFFTFLIGVLSSLAGLALLAMGLWMRFDKTEWENIQKINNGEIAVYIYIGVGAGLFVISMLGMYGAGKPRRRISLFLFQLGTLALCIVSAYGSVVLFKAVPKNKHVDQMVNQLNHDLSSHLTPSAQEFIENPKYQRDFAIFLASVAGAEFLAFLCSIILCFQKPVQSPLPQYVSHNSPPAKGAAAISSQPVQFA